MADINPTVPDNQTEEHVKQLMEPNMPDSHAAEGLTGQDPAAPDKPAIDEDAETDQAVEAITRQEADQTLKAQDSAVAEAQVMKPKLRKRLAHTWAAWWRTPRKRYSTVAVILIIFSVLAAVPATRYRLLGLVLKRQITVAVVDSKTGAPISGAMVQIGGLQGKTEVSGKTSLRARLGSVTIYVTKNYYQAAAQTVTVTFSSQHNNFSVPLRALGRQVPVKVVNKITGAPLAGAVLNVQGGETKTDKNGVATVVLASSATSQQASVSLSGYNTAMVTIQAVNSIVPANTFNLTPAGKLYFLSNQSGKIDVVKTNLDGTDRQTVLAGTGNEDPSSSSLLASRDWKYLALLAKRDSGASASLYLIDTTNGDKLTTIDQGNATFNPIGWSGDTFVYSLNRNNVQSWQPKAQALKSYDATSGKLTLLDETTAEGTGSNDYGYTSFTNVYILNNELVYAQNWYSSYYSNHLNGKSVNLVSIRPDGTGHKVIKAFAIPVNSSYYSVNLSLYKPYGVYVQVPGTGSNTYYSYENGTLTARPDITDSVYNAAYATYLISPSGNSTFWTEQRDGKNTLFVGDINAANPKQIATLSDFKPYGWYSDNYLLVSKNSSELYILPVSGSANPIKITDYYKPPINYNGYGGGYGGL